MKENGPQTSCVAWREAEKAGMKELKAKYQCQSMKYNLRNVGSVILSSM